MTAVPDIVKTLRDGGFIDHDLLLHATAWRWFRELGVTEENRRDVYEALRGVKA